MMPSDDDFDALLKDGLRRPELPCDGFDRRVLAALARRRPALPLYGLAVSLGALSAASGLAYGAYLWASQVDIGAWMDRGLSAPWSGAALSLAACSCLYAGWAALGAFGVRRPARL